MVLNYLLLTIIEPFRRVGIEVGVGFPMPTAVLWLTARRCGDHFSLTSCTCDWKLISDMTLHRLNQILSRISDQDINGIPS